MVRVRDGFSPGDRDMLRELDEDLSSLLGRLSDADDIAREARAAVQEALRR